MMYTHILKLLLCALYVQAVPLLPQRTRKPTPRTSELNTRPSPPTPAQPLPAAWAPLRLRVFQSADHNVAVGNSVRAGRYNPAQVPETYYRNTNMQSDDFLAVMPRPMQHHDIINISGKVAKEPYELKITLAMATGSGVLDASNIALELRADFTNDLVTLSLVKDGEHNVEANADLYFERDGDFDLSFIMESDKITVNHGGSALGVVPLKHSLAEISFLKASGDIAAIKELLFKFANGT